MEWNQAGQVPPDVVLQFPALRAVPGISHAFLLKIPGVDVLADKETALRRLAETHQTLRKKYFPAKFIFATAEQVHSNQIAVLCADQELPSFPASGADGLLTNRMDVVLGIYVADCAAVFLADRKSRAIGLIHSGKKGTEQEIVSHALHTMQERFGSNPPDILVQIGPCIRPPHYENDFAATIFQQATEFGAEVVDCGECTAADPARFYSYRMEKGRTGRMLALIAAAK